jgi:hypothetical protein
MNNSINLYQIAETYNISICIIKALARLGHFGEATKDSRKIVFNEEIVNKYFKVILSNTIIHEDKVYKQYRDSKVYFSREGDFITTSNYRINTEVGGVDRDGYLTVNGVRVHRGVYETYLGEIPTGKEIDHIDSNNKNNAISNLRAVTAAENKMYQHINRKGNYKLSQIDANIIRSCYNAGEAVKDIYTRYVDKVTNIASIHNIVANRTWVN